EGCVLDPTNPYVLGPHLVCAAAESPLLDAEVTPLFGPTAGAVLADLAGERVLRRRATGWFWPHPSERPAAEVDIRGGGGQVVVVEADTGRMLGTSDASTAPATLHPGAVYLHQGASFVVDSLELDPGEGLALVHAEDPDWTTTARSVVEVEIVGAEGGETGAGAVEASAIGTGAIEAGAAERAAWAVAGDAEAASAQGAGVEAVPASAQGAGPEAGVAGDAAEHAGGARVAGADPAGLLAGRTEHRHVGGVSVHLGEVVVSSQVVSFIRRRRSGELIDTVPLDMP